VINNHMIIDLILI